MEKIQNEGQVDKPFEHKSIRFRFPEMERSGLIVAEIKKLNMEYDGTVSSDEITSVPFFGVFFMFSCLILVWMAVIV